MTIDSCYSRIATQVKMTRLRICNHKRLVAWRKRQGLTQAETAHIFHLKTRAYQNLEADNLKEFPAYVDDLAFLYEIRNPKDATAERTASGGNNPSAHASAPAATGR